MPPLPAILALAALLAGPMQSEASGWVLQPPEGDRGAVLTIPAGEKVSYRFACTGTEVAITETGVTKLVDLQTGDQIGDGPDAVMPKGAAMMALFAGKGSPNFVPAEATKNPAGGWDLTIRLTKTDKQLKAMAKSEMMSLFTTGHTIAVLMDADTRAMWRDFLQRC